MRKHYLSLLLPFIFACQLSGVLEPTPAPPTSPNSTPITDEITNETVGGGTGLIPDGPLLGEVVPLPPVSFEPFAVTEPVPVQIPAVVQLYTPNLAQISNLDQYALSELERQQLGQDGYLERSDKVSTTADVYANNGPHMLTTDLVLAYTYAIQRDVLNSAAREFSDKQTYDLLNGLIAESWEQLAAAGDPLTQQAAAKNLAIFNIGGKFYDENWPIVPEVAEQVETELTLFQSMGEFESPLLGQRANYGLMRQNPSSSVRLFAWFQISSPEINLQQSPAEQRLAGKQIELLLEIWSAGTVPAWQTRYIQQRYQNGFENYPIEAWQVLYELGVRNDDFVQSALLFESSRLNILPRPKSAQQQIFEQLVFNNVGIHFSPEGAPKTAKQESVGTIRALPSSLDIAAAFGSQLALEQLQRDGEAGYVGWEEQMADLQADLNDTRRWPVTYQHEFLKAIRPLAQLVPSSYPVYMHSAGWDPLARWKTAFLLSTKPITDFSIIDLEISADEMIYLEPRPDLYANLAAQTRSLAERLVAQQMLDGPNAERLLALESDLLQLKQIAEKQLAGVRANSKESTQLASFLSRAATANFNGAVPIYSGPHGSLAGQFSGYVPTLFVVLDGNRQIVVQGGRLQALIGRE